VTTIVNRDRPGGRDRVVFVTQAYAPGETLLGVTADWVRALGSRFAGVDVIAQRGPGAPSLLPRPRTPLRVASMGKDRGVGRLGQGAMLVASLARAARRACAIFVHMVPRYALLAAPVARLAGVPIVLWYAHGTADRALRLAMPFVDLVVTPTRDSFPLAGPGTFGKVRVTGHGIDTGRYLPAPGTTEPGLVLSAGRLSPVKRHELAVQAVAGGPEGWRLVIAGSPLHAADVAYREHLLSLASCPTNQERPPFPAARGSRADGGQDRERWRPSPFPPAAYIPLRGRMLAQATALAPTEEGIPLSASACRAPVGEEGSVVTLVGDVPFAEMPELYRRAWVLAHASRTGSLDKVVLEASACGTPVVSSAPSSRAILHAVPGLSVPDGDDEAFVARLREVLGWSTERRDAAGRALRAAVVSGHSLDHWADGVTSAVACASVGGNFPVRGARYGR
jgi:glycosyltransferase involved in cell wall biosynthesis